MCKEKECNNNQEEQNKPLNNCVYLQKKSCICIIDGKKCSDKACELQGITL